MHTGTLLNTARPGGYMPRRGPKKKALGTYIPEPLHDDLREYSEETGIPISRVVEDALRMLLAERRGHAAQHGGDA